MPMPQAAALPLLQQTPCGESGGWHDADPGRLRPAVARESPAFLLVRIRTKSQAGVTSMECIL